MSGFNSKAKLNFPVFLRFYSYACFIQVKFLLLVNLFFELEANLNCGRVWQTKIFNFVPDLFQCSENCKLVAAGILFK